MLGKIYTLTVDPRGFTRMLFECRVPYATEWKRFNIWNMGRLEKVLETEACVGLEVKFEEGAAAKFPTLTAIEQSLFGTCEECHAYYELGDTQVSECGRCGTVEPREYMDEKVMLVHKQEKSYTFSSGISLTFADRAETTSWSTCIFANNPFYEKVGSLIEKKEYIIRGWISSRQDRGLDGVKCLVDFTVAPE